MGWFDGMFGGQAPPPSDPYGGLMQGYAAPGMIQQQLQPLLNAQLGQPMAQLSLDQQLANQGYGNTMAGLGIRQGGLNRELGFFPQQQGIANQLINLSRSDLDSELKRLDLSKANLGLNRERLGLQGQGLDISQRIAQQQAEQARRGAWSSATARGATVGEGFRQGLGDISSNLANQLQQLGLSRQNLGISGRELDLGSRGIDLNWMGLLNQSQRLGLGQQQSDIGFALRGGNLQDQLAMLGLAQTQAGQGLNQSLQQAGLNAATGTTNIGMSQLSGALQGAMQVPGQAGQVGALGQGVAPRPVGQLPTKAGGLNFTF